MLTNIKNVHNHTSGIRMEDIYPPKIHESVVRHALHLFSRISNLLLKLWMDGERKAEAPSATSSECPQDGLDHEIIFNDSDTRPYQDDAE